MKTFRSLKEPNFRYWFIGQGFSVLGTWMQITAIGFLVFDLTGSPVYLGLTGFATGISAWFFTLYAGAAADHYSKRSILIGTQILAMIVGIVLATMTQSGIIRPWHIIVLSFFSGAVAAVEAPARQALVAELVGRKNLGNAISLNSSIFNLGTAVGPAISGALYLIVGPVWCFGINAISYIPLIIALVLINIPAPLLLDHTRPSLSKVKEGINYSYSNSIVRSLMAMVAVISAFGFSVFSLMPAWAVSVLHGNAGTNGMLQSARGVGALTGALTIAARGHGNRRGRILCAVAILYPFALLFFAFTRNVISSVILTAIIGTSFVIFYNTANTLLQSLAPDAIRGRVMSVYMLAFMGMTPLGSLAGGCAAKVFGERGAVILCAMSALFLMSILVAVSPSLRRQS